ncbi:hypothetical protein DVR12_21995 [Chitinophaga silvatica]|uniref:Uncharacterized protein n=1 Tax=Chitinophaga silvatica TaxID=2282649 RepID=A0A3E1Y516_9BACT|nr:hypothetical protein [Chitinophaga silvatica]RFS19771.1 hypothetical protein DVR12_21995 [Chitinophaga silvatica]
MSKRSLSQLAKAIFFFGIAILFMMYFTFYVNVFYSVWYYINNLNVRSYGEIITLGQLAITSIGTFGFGRLGIRMLDTERKYFEYPQAKRGPLKISGSILLMLLGLLILMSGVLIIYDHSFHINGEYTFSENWQTDFFVSLLLISLCFYLFFLAYKLRGSAFKKQKSEFLGELV